MRWQSMYVALVCAIFVIPTFAQGTDSPKTRNAVCTFTDGKEIRISYTPVPAKKKEDLPHDKLWTPGDSPMYLFTQTQLSIEGKKVAPGAYAMYIIPGDDKWTLVLNKNVTAGSQYDEKQDMVRAPMQIGHLDQSQAFSLIFGHMAPKQCNVRIYYRHIGTWTEFNEQ